MNQKVCPKRNSSAKNRILQIANAAIAKPKMTFVSNVSEPWMDPLKYSSWIRVTRVTALVMTSDEEFPISNPE
ncbi:hypothetical protein ACROYT_G022286 [Oculina patagonica]